MHHHGHEHSRVADRRLLAVALVLIVGLMAGEVAAGLVAGSLALLADAGHLLTDAAALCLRSSWTLLRESGRIFMEGSPAGIDPDEVAAALASDPEVVEVHDLHIWTVTSGFPALAAHVLVSPQTDCHSARRRLQRLLHDRYRLHHVTLQVDHVAQRSQPVEIASRRADD
jgi:cobalt-zinc-cadmium efflux system protein